MKRENETIALWSNVVQHKFTFAGFEAIIIEPDETLPGKPCFWIPEWLTFPVKLLVSFGIGFGGGAGVYAAFRNKTNKALKDFSRGAINAEEVRRDEK